MRTRRFSVCVVFNLRRRNDSSSEILTQQARADGEHDFAATDAEFELISRYFVAPSVDEGLVVSRQGIKTR